MQESYREGIANHPGPEPCEGSREAALEALHRGICRLGIELRKRYSRMPDRKSTRLNSSHRCISYAVFCLKKKKKKMITHATYHGMEFYLAEHCIDEQL